MTDGGIGAVLTLLRNWSWVAPAGFTFVAVLWAWLTAREYREDPFMWGVLAGIATLVAQGAWLFWFVAGAIL